MTEKVEPIMSHIKELRKMIVNSILAIFVSAILTFSFIKEPVMNFFTGPLEKFNADLIYVTVSEAFTTQIKVCLLAGLIFAFPLVLWFIWRFIEPALFPKEKKAIGIIFPIAIGLFVLGIAFAYFVVLPFALQFFLVTIPGDLQPMLTVGDYVKFLYGFLFPFGLVFLLPLVITFLAKWGIVDYTQLARVRKYVFFVIVVLAAVLTPPDVISQMALAIPVYFLYEFSIFIARIIGKREREKEEDYYGDEDYYQGEDYDK